MANLLKLIPLKTLIKLVLLLLDYIAKKTETSKDDEVIAFLYKALDILEPYIPLKVLKQKGLK